MKFYEEQQLQREKENLLLLSYDITHNKNYENLTYGFVKRVEHLIDERLEQIKRKLENE